MIYHSNKIPVQYSLDALKEFIGQYADFYFCVYLAEKDSAGWDKSTSRVYMNQLFNNFLYIPVNIAKDDESALREFYKLALVDKRIVAINQTQPHKSNPVCKELFGDPESDDTIDTLVRDAETGSFSPLSINAPALVDWFTEDVTPLDGKNLVLLGVGGVGEPIARLASEYNLKSLTLVDPIDKSALADELSTQQPTTYAPHLSHVDFDAISSNLVLMSAAGKEGSKQDTGLSEVFDCYSRQGEYFVDIRPHLEIDVVEEAEAKGWNAYTGYHMNARNDHILVKEICDRIGVEPPSFEDFSSKVAAAS